MTLRTGKNGPILRALVAFALLLLGSGVLGAQQDKAGQNTTAELQLLQCALKVTGMNCNGCVTSVQSGLLKVEGVKKAQVDLKTGRVDVEYDAKKIKPEKIVASFNEANPGYRAAVAESQDQSGTKK